MKNIVQKEEKLNPEDHEGIVLKKTQKTAAGIPAVLNSAKHVYGEVGVVDGTKLMSQINQFHGFDCPGCAWPDPDHHRSFAEFCENGAKAVAEEATTAKADPAFFKKHSVEQLLSWNDYEIGKSGRITQPMLLRPGNQYYEPVTWADAFNLIGKQLNAIKPDEAIFYTSGRTSNEAAFLYQLFVRQYGTNNLPDCSNMCHESSGTGLTETVGIGKGSTTLEDFYEAEVIMIMGQNPGTNHPRMLSALQKAKNNGAKIISVNPLPETGLMNFKNPQLPQDMLVTQTQLTDIFMQVRLNGDIPLLKALMKMLIEREGLNPGTVLDQEFMQSHTEGYEALKADLDQYTLDELIEQTSVSKELFHEAANLLARKNKIIVCWAMGLTQHKNGVDNIREVVNLLLMKGSIGKKGAGTCPVRGHSNVQGDRTMGIWEKLKPAFGDKLKEVFNFEPPRENGYDVMHSIEAMATGKARFFLGMGGNFLSATPDTAYTAKGLRQCDMTVHVSTKLNRSHLVHGKTAMILPCLGRTERDMQEGGKQFVTVENSTGVVHQSTGNRVPVSKDLYSEPAIIAHIAMATLKENTTVDWKKMISNYDHIRNAVEKTIPGFENFNERVRHDGGFYLPNGARERDFKTETGKARFTINRMPDHQLKDGEYLMMTMRSHDQYNTTIYGLHDRYRGIHYDRRVVLMNQNDMDRAGLEKEDIVDLVSEYDGKQRVAMRFLVVPYSIPEKCVGTYFPEANVLVPHNRAADGSNQPISKSVVISLEKVK